MANDERDFFRDALMSGTEPSDELRERFAEQIETLLRRKLSTLDMIGRVIGAAIFGGMSLFFAYFARFAVVAQDEGVSATARLVMVFCFAGGALVFLGGAAYVLLEIRSGLKAPRGRQKAIVWLTYAFVLALVTSMLIFVPKLGLPLERMVWMGVTLLIFWVMATFNVLLWEGRWRREDVLLEQKRTRLEIALLREDLSKEGASR